MRAPVHHRADRHMLRLDSALVQGVAFSFNFGEGAFRTHPLS
ncbi:hypothetical protein [Actinoplanes regularis]|nr:hypothetical protein [Actinoplanes regularis]